MRKAIQIVQESGAQFVFARTNDPARRELDYHGISELVGGEKATTRQS